MLGLIFLINPYLFSLQDDRAFGLVVISVVFMTILLPLVAIVALRFTGLVQSITMEDRMERIGPLIITGIFYLWLFMNIRSNNTIPTPYVTFVLGATIGLFLCFFINNFSKISLHACGIAGVLAFIFYLRTSYTYDFFVLEVFQHSYKIHIDLILMLVIGAFGLVATSRLILKQHRLSDIYGGALVGIIAQIIAIRILG